MAVTPEDAQRIAALARLELGAEDAVAMSQQLSSILAHMEALGRVDVREAPAVAAVTEGPAPLREDRLGPDPLVGPASEIAPAWQDQFFVVPRLAALDADALVEGGSA